MVEQTERASEYQRRLEGGCHACSSTTTTTAKGEAANVLFYVFANLTRLSEGLYLENSQSSAYQFNRNVQLTPHLLLRRLSPGNH